MLVNPFSVYDEPSHSYQLARIKNTLHMAALWYAEANDLLPMSRKFLLSTTRKDAKRTKVFVHVKYKTMEDIEIALITRPSVIITSTNQSGWRLISTRVSELRSRESRLKHSSTSRENEKCHGKCQEKTYAGCHWLIPRSPMHLSPCIEVMPPSTIRKLQNAKKKVCFTWPYMEIGLAVVGGKSF